MAPPPLPSHLPALSSAGGAVPGALNLLSPPLPTLPPLLLGRWSFLAPLPADDDAIAAAAAAVVVRAVVVRDVVASPGLFGGHVGVTAVRRIAPIASRGLGPEEEDEDEVIACPRVTPSAVLTTPPPEDVAAAAAAATRGDRRAVRDTW